MHCRLTRPPIVFLFVQSFFKKELFNQVILSEGSLHFVIESCLNNGWKKHLVTMVQSEVVDSILVRCPSWKGGKLSNLPSSPSIQHRKWREAHMRGEMRAAGKGTDKRSTRVCCWGAPRMFPLFSCLFVFFFVSSFFFLFSTSKPYFVRKKEANLPVPGHCVPSPKLGA